jgi:hypothetical protein
VDELFSEDGPGAHQVHGSGSRGQGPGVRIESVGGHFGTLTCHSDKVFTIYLIKLFF